MFFCSDPGQGMIEQKIREHKLNRVIVAACSPSLHEKTFRRNISRAGLNQYLFEHCNVREQVSWVVEDHELATQKASRLVRAAVARAAHLVPLDKRRIPIYPSALVIGGGVAGLTAARDLASRGIAVTLIESSPFLGGRLAQLHRIYPTGQKARDVIGPLIREVTRIPRSPSTPTRNWNRPQGLSGFPDDRPAHAARCDQRWPRPAGGHRRLSRGVPGPLQPGAIEA